MKMIIFGAIALMCGLVGLCSLCFGMDELVRGYFRRASLLLLLGFGSLVGLVATVRQGVDIWLGPVGK